MCIPINCNVPVLTKCELCRGEKHTFSPFLAHIWQAIIATHLISLKACQNLEEKCCYDDEYPQGSDDPNSTRGAESLAKRNPS